MQMGPIFGHNFTNSVLFSEVTTDSDYQNMATLDAANSNPTSDQPLDDHKSEISNDDESMITDQRPLVNISSFWDIVPYKSSELSIPSLKQNYPFWEIHKGTEHACLTIPCVYMIYIQYQ